MSLWTLIRGLLGDDPSGRDPLVTPVPTPPPAPPKAEPKPVPPSPYAPWQYALAPILGLLGHTEGTDKRRGYDETLAYGMLTGGDKNLTSMTLQQIDALQTEMLKHPKNKWNSSALGRYQIVRTTLRGLRAKLSQQEIFSADLQDKFAAKLLVRRGLIRWIAGSLTSNAFIDQLAMEWASIPKSSGVGHYSGQLVGATVGEVHQALAATKARLTGAAVEEIDRITKEL